MSEPFAERIASDLRSQLRSYLEDAYSASVRRLREAPPYLRLKHGRALASDYDALIIRICETHLLSAQFVAFAFSLAPPEAAPGLARHLLEELGTERARGLPALLTRLLDRAGLADREGAARQAGLLRLRERVMEPLFYGSLREVGLAALVEIVGFELMLSRMASEFAGFLREHRKLPDDALEWFAHHSEADLERAEQGLDAVAEYAEYYQLGIQEAMDIVDSALEENIYLKHYFGARAAALG